MTLHERVIFYLLRRMHRGVGLYVTHMMDMDRYYRVLDGKGEREWRTLRLCFGHAGGELGWFGLQPEEPRECEPPEKSFADEVIAICSTKHYPNVFCELGYLNELREKPAAAKLQARLIAAIAASEEKKELASRICFGTDWHMPEMCSSIRSSRSTRTHSSRGTRSGFSSSRESLHGAAAFDPRALRVPLRQRVRRDRGFDRVLRGGLDPLARQARAFRARLGRGPDRGEEQRKRDQQREDRDSRPSRHGRRV